MKKYRFEIILFIIDAVCMILELVASRLLSPYFGNSNIVWTSVIGIILLSSSIGNYIGGKIADKENREQNLKIVLIFVSLTMLIIPFFENNILKQINEFIDSTKIGAILATMILFFVPSMFIGVITPLILKIKLFNIETAGKTAGKVNAIATIGGIFGTFLGGFVLVPNIGSLYIIFILSIITILLVPIVDFKLKNMLNIVVGVIVIISSVAFVININLNKDNGIKVLNNSSEEYFNVDTQYGRVIISNTQFNGEDIRLLSIDKGAESASFTDSERKYELVFKYTQKYDLMFNSNNEINSTLLIGGAGYSYPKYYISKYLDKNMDVVEIDSKITEIAKKYFFLNDLIEEYNLNENKRLNLINEDGRVYLNKNNKKYDAILNDAFSGESPAKTLTTIEAVTQIKKSLNTNGLYLSNIISSLDGNNSKFIKAEVNTLKQVFKNVYVIPCGAVDNVLEKQNNIVIATDDEMYIPNDVVYSLNLTGYDLVLTDEYCPVDTLVPQTN